MLERQVVDGVSTAPDLHKTIPQLPRSAFDEPDGRRAVLSTSEARSRTARLGAAGRQRNYI